MQPCIFDPLMLLLQAVCAVHQPLLSGTNCFIYMLTLLPHIMVAAQDEAAAPAGTRETLVLCAAVACWMHVRATPMSCNASSWSFT